MTFILPDYKFRLITSKGRINRRIRRLPEKTDEYLDWLKSEHPKLYLFAYDQAQSCEADDWMDVLSLVFAPALFLIELPARHLIEQSIQHFEREYSLGKDPAKAMRKEYRWANHDICLTAKLIFVDLYPGDSEKQIEVSYFLMNVLYVVFYAQQEDRELQERCGVKGG